VAWDIVDLSRPAVILARGFLQLRIYESFVWIETDFGVGSLRAQNVVGDVGGWFKDQERHAAEPL